VSDELDESSGSISTFDSLRLVKSKLHCLFLLGYSFTLKANKMNTFEIFQCSVPTYLLLLKFNVHG